MTEIEQFTDQEFVQIAKHQFANMQEAMLSFAEAIRRIDKPDLPQHSTASHMS